MCYLRGFIRDNEILIQVEITVPVSWGPTRTKVFRTIPQVVAARGDHCPCYCNRIIAAGEIGLAGEIRQIRGADKIASEAASLGFTRFILPQSSAAKIKTPTGLTLVGVSDIREAIALLQL